MPDKTAALILAAGQGKRMQSELPKVLHTCAGVPMLAHAVRAAAAAGCAPIVVVASPGHADAIAAAARAAAADTAVGVAVQAEPRGTGDAAQAGLAALPADFLGSISILYGDTPLLTAATLRRLQEAGAGAPLAVLTAQVANPFGYGRVVRAGAQVLKVVEERDCSPNERALNEINAGVYCAQANLLRAALSALTPNNAQGELYLTDIVAFAAAAGGARGVEVADLDEILGVNGRAELARAERLWQARLVAEHQARGVTFRDPAGTSLGLDVHLEADVELGMGVQLSGRTHIARGSLIEGPTVVVDSHVGPGSRVRAFCHLEGVELVEGAEVGPFARLRPGARLEAGARVGNFVEVKGATLGANSKVNHLSYVGDATVGAGSNLGAGVITCNYDGVQKHKTEVGAGSFVGSNATLVAPLRLGAGSFVAAGSTITDDVPDDALAFGRARQATRPGGAAELRARLRGAAPTKQKGS